ncbi:MAG: Hsp20/alpha crystallin family protein [Chloroflexota bacterium]
MDEAARQKRGSPAMLYQWDPNRRFRRMERLMNRMWNDLGQAAAGEAVEAWTPPVDVKVTRDSIIVSASMPGVRPEDASVRVENGVLTIRGQTGRDATEAEEGQYVARERRIGAFYRSLRLPEEADHQHAESDMDAGVLTIRFPVRQPNRPRRVDVDVK